MCLADCRMTQACCKREQVYCKMFLADCKMQVGCRIHQGTEPPHYKRLKQHTLHHHSLCKTLSEGVHQAN